MRINKKLEDILVWITAIGIPIGFLVLIGSFEPLGMAFIGLIALVFLAGILSSLIQLFQKTCKWSDRYTNLPKLSSVKPLTKKVFIPFFVLLLAFATFTLLGKIPLIYSKVIGISYIAWLFYIFLGWLDSGGIEENADNLTEIVSVIVKGIGIVGGIYLLLQLSNTAVLFLFFAPMVFALLANLFFWIKKRIK